MDVQSNQISNIFDIQLLNIHPGVEAGRGGLGGEGCVGEGR